MPKRATSLRRVAIAAIAAASLVLPLMSVAQAQQGGEGSPAAGMPLKKHRARAAHKELYNSTRDPYMMQRGTGGWTPNADPSFHDYSTFPEGDPNYHGSNGS